VNHFHYLDWIELILAIFGPMKLTELQYFCLNLQIGNEKVIIGFGTSEGYCICKLDIFVVETCLIVIVSIYFLVSYRGIGLCAGVLIP
jgi:hypothetical protein